jgi:ecdysone 20-monooxygenase
VYFIVILFFCYTYKNKKPIKWNEALHAITFSQRNDDTFRIPGPLRLPFIGTKWNSFFIKMTKLHEYYAELNQKFGPVALEMAGSVPVVSLFNKTDIDKVLKYPSKYPFRPPTDIAVVYRQSRPDRYSSTGLVNEQGPEWAHLRSKLTPKTFENRKVIAEFCPDLNEIIDDFITLLKARRNEDNIVESVEDNLKLLSFEGACCMVLGKRVGFLTDSGDNTPRDLQDIMKSAKNIFECTRDSYYGKFGF